MVDGDIRNTRGTGGSLFSIVSCSGADLAEVVVASGASGSFPGALHGRQ